MCYISSCVSKIVSRLFIESDKDLNKTKVEIRHAQENLLKRVEKSAELEMSEWKMCAVVSLMLFEKSDSEEGEIKVEARSLLKSSMHAV